MWSRWEVLVKELIREGGEDTNSAYALSLSVCNVEIGYKPAKPLEESDHNAPLPPMKP